jgi:hypothetical protein
MAQSTYFAVCGLELTGEVGVVGAELFDARQRGIQPVP